MIVFIAFFSLVLQASPCFSYSRSYTIDLSNSVQAPEANHVASVYAVIVRVVMLANMLPAPATNKMIQTITTCLAGQLPTKALVWPAFLFATLTRHYLLPPKKTRPARIEHAFAEAWRVY